MTRITAPWISHPATRAVMVMLEEAGHQAFFVGGCVRNALLDEPVADIDISTDARPDKVAELAEAVGLKPVPTGIEHGTVTVVSDHIPHEVTTFRKDVETDGRRAVVAYSDRVEEDAHRRDFTMNALYARADGEVVDPLGGMPDLDARRVRFIDDPGERIREDFLRILRFFRFHAHYGDPDGGLDPEGLAACAAHLEGIDTLSRERIGAELLKLLAAPDPGPSVAAMEQAGVLARVLPGASITALLPLIHLEGQVQAPIDPVRRLAALGGEDVKDRLRLSKDRARRVALLREAAAGIAGAAELGYRLGQTDGRDAILLRAAMMGTPLPEELDSELALGAAAELPVSAKDLMPTYEGPALGEKLKALEAAWIASGFTLDRDALLA